MSERSVLAEPRGPVRWRGHAGQELDAKGEHRVIACEPCGFNHIVPIPTEAELEELYREELYGTDIPDYIESHRRDAAWWRQVHRERYETLEEHLRDRGPGRRLRILDVGSGPGYFLLEGQERGWEALGIEPARQAVAHARGLGLTIVEGFLDAESAPGLGTFDAVHLNAVLEHVPDPRGMLELCRGMLAPDGLVCVSVPNDYNPFQQVLREACRFEPWWVVPPLHVNYFGHASMARLLARTGFEVVLQEATFPIDLFLLMGDDYVHEGELGRACHAKRKAFEARMEEAGMGRLKRELYAKLAEVGLGRQTLTFARRA